MMLRDDGSRQLSYVYTQVQAKVENFIPIVSMFAQGATSEQTTVVLEFDTRNILLSYSATTGDMAIGTGFSSGQKQ